MIMSAGVPCARPLCFLLDANYSLAVSDTYTGLRFTHTQPREADAFGLDRRIALIPATRLRDLVAALAKAYPQPS